MVAFLSVTPRANYHPENCMDDKEQEQACYVTSTVISCSNHSPFCLGIVHHYVWHIILKFIVDLYVLGKTVYIGFLSVVAGSY